MLRCWVTRELCPWLARGMRTQRSLFGTVQGWRALFWLLLVAGLRAEGPGAPGPCATLPRVIGCRPSICSTGL